jgi:hypothetical protein
VGAGQLAAAFADDPVLAQELGWTAGSDPCGAVGWKGIDCGGGAEIRGMTLSSFSGALPAALFAISSLQEVRLTGAISSLPPAIGALTGLTALVLSGTLGGSLPTEVALLTNLRTMDLAGVGLSGPLPAGLFTLPALQALNLRGNGLVGTLPSASRLRRRLAAGSSGSMTKLDLSENPGLSGTIPSTLYQLGPLTSINIAGTRLSGQVRRAKSSG